MARIGATGLGGENGDRSDKALDPSQVAQSTIHLRMEGNERAWKEHYKAVLAWAKRTSPGDRLRSNRWVGRVKKNAELAGEERTRTFETNRATL